MFKQIAPEGMELIAQPNSRSMIPTPALLLDLDNLETNITFAAKKAEEKRIFLRPHCKCHKNKKIAQLQIEAGAIGISCATLGEAEQMGEENIRGILITSPIVSPYKIARLMELNRKVENLLLVVDCPKNVKNLALANRKANKPLQILIDFDIGQNRTGVKSPHQALNLYSTIESCPELRFVGIQAYGGHFQHIASYSERAEMIRVQNLRIKELKALLQEKNLQPLIVTGGGTGTFDIDLNEAVYTELQIGSYIFMDVEYSEVSLTEKGNPFNHSLFVLSTVVSSHLNTAIVDAGLKAFATDGPTPKVSTGVDKNTPFQFMGDEHGKITTKDKNIPVGTTLEFLIPHCDPTVNLYDFYHCVRAQQLVDIWNVDARGKH